MQMDISKWIQFNPKITVEQTTKKYFGKYLFKIVVYCPAGRLIDSKGSMNDALIHRREVHKSINYGGYWGNRNNKNLDKADVEFLEVLRELRNNDLLGIKLRVEEPSVQIYAESEEKLYEIVTKYFSHLQNNYITAIAGPVDKNAEDILNSGAIIRKKDVGYTHKIIIRDGRYGTDLKQNLLVYLESMGPEIAKVSKSGTELLRKSSGYIWNLYVYTNDPSIVTFLNLIDPNLVLNCHQLIVKPHK